MATKTQDKSVKKKEAIDKATPTKEELAEEVEIAASDVVAEEVQKEEAEAAVKKADKKADKKAAPEKAPAKKKAASSKKAAEKKAPAAKKSAGTEPEEKAAATQSEKPAAKAPVTGQAKDKPSRTGQPPKTMEELLSLADYDLVVPKRGEKVIGTITAKGRKMLTIDIGAKTEGIVADKEFDAAREYIGELEVGQEIEAVVAAAESSSGQILLSLKKAASDARWDYFEEAYENEDVLDAKGIDVNKGGLIVVVNGTRGFVPSSQFGKDLVGNYHQLRGQDLRVRVIEVDREKNRLIFSERHVSEADEIAHKEQALEAVEIGGTYEGVVSGVMHFGLFITVEVPVTAARLAMLKAWCTFLRFPGKRFPSQGLSSSRRPGQGQGAGHR